MRKTLLIEDFGFTDLCPCDAGFEDCEPSHKFGPSIRNYYLLHFVVSGRGRFTTARGEYTLEAGQAFLIKPGEVTVYQADAVDPWCYSWLGFRGKLSDAFSTLADVFEYDTSILDELKAAEVYEGRKEALYASICFKLYAKFTASAISPDYTSRVKGYINVHYMDNVTVTQIADTLGLNRKYLARIFKAKNGVSMQEYLIDKRLHEAKKLLLLGYNVEESAYMVGYRDPFGFSKAFKKKYGIAPISFKKNKKENRLP